MGMPVRLPEDTPTSTLEFRPGFYRDVTDFISDKLDALEPFSMEGRGPRELSARFAQAAARYWGRFADFAEVEPFEVLK